MNADETKRIGGLMRWIISCVVCIWAATAVAQDATRTALVLDASGSMWGQIDGTAKITIAQSVIGDLLDTLTDTQELGLTVYGHRVEGNCADIEVMVPVAAGNRATIRAAVNGISPKGKTPLSDAVLIAADSLGFTELPATVILVTDGLETCDRDPCALGRSLEAGGIDFTAHVIGFDVAEVDRPRLQCLADETGGKYLTAANAAELGAALSEVAAAPPAAEPAEPIQQPEPRRLTANFSAQAGPGGWPIDSALEWTLIGPNGPEVEGHMRNQLVADLIEGAEYRVIARRPQDGVTVEITVNVATEGYVETLVFPN